MKGLRLGMPREYFVGGMEPEVEAAVKAAIQVLEDLGAELGESSLPHTDYGLPRTTSSPRRNAAPTWHATTASSTASAPPDAENMWD